MKKNLTPKKTRLARKTPRPEPAADRSLPFVEHLHELRRRVIYIVASVLVFSTLAYFIQQQIVNFLLRPSKGQQFIYTSPGGGINFLFTVCMYVGVAASIPIIIYQVLGFFEPLLRARTKHLIVRYSCLSGILATLGFCFGYFLGLPGALHFLGNQFTTRQIHALFTIQEYASFIAVYLLGWMLIFQLPVILLFINRIRPLKPGKLLGAERYVIVAAVVVGMIMAPTPDLLTQLMVIGPIILMYNLSILLIWKINRPLTPSPIEQMPIAVPQLSQPSPLSRMPSSRPPRLVDPLIRQRPSSLLSERPARPQLKPLSAHRVMDIHFTTRSPRQAAA